MTKGNYSIVKYLSTLLKKLTLSEENTVLNVVTFLDLQSDKNLTLCYHKRSLAWLEIFLLLG